MPAKLTLTACPETTKSGTNDQQGLHLLNR
jgi:hypothetical protein